MPSCREDVATGAALADRPRYVMKPGEAGPISNFVTCGTAAAYLDFSTHECRYRGVPRHAGGVAGRSVSRAMKRFSMCDPAHVDSYGFKELISNL